MTYEEFKRELCRQLQQQRLPGRAGIILLEKGVRYGDEGRKHILRMVNLRDCGKEDDVLADDVLCVLWKRMKNSSILHWKVRTLYEQFKREGWQTILPGLVSQIRQLSEQDRMLMKENNGGKGECLLLRPVYYPNLCEDADSVIFRRFGDIALVIYRLVQRDAENLITVKLQREMVKNWNMADEVLLTNALLNTYTLMPPRLYYGGDIRSHYDDYYGVFMPGEKGISIQVHPKNEKERFQGYLLTTNYGRYGAVALFYPGVKERLAELLGGDYYVGFTSIHGVAIHPVGHKVLHRLKDSVYRSNIVPGSREMLSPQVYCYSCKRKELIEV